MEHCTLGPGACPVCGLVPLTTSRRPVRVIAESKAMQALLRRAGRFAVSEAPVAIFGETGTGKEVIARTLHANSARAERPFVPVNVAALPAELLESELFGHARGAFTGARAAKAGLFEEANGGTLFLDELAEMPLLLQAKLLRVLQDGEVRRVGETRSFEVDVRTVCATHGDLAGAVRRGAFREDLYYRLKVLSLRVPPLRERADDILLLAEQFLCRFGAGRKRFGAAAAQALCRHGWPGNVRELENAVRHAAALATGPTIGADDLPEEIVHPALTPARPAASRSELRSLAEVEREHILGTLDACDGSQAEAARVLGIGRNTLWRKLRAYA